MNAVHQDFHQAFASIDTSRPWLMPFLAIHQAYQADGVLPLASWLDGYFSGANIGMTSHTGRLLNFTNQSDLPHGVAYERYIGDTGKIPTRDNLHDWFGACIWATFPKSKAMLNHHHLQHLSDDNHGNGRNRIRDAITVFDENGIVLAVCDDIGADIKAHLCAFDWQNALVKPKAHWHNPSNPTKHAHAQAFVFGHALLEQLIHPRKNLCGHTLFVTVERSFFELDENDKLAVLDEMIASQLDCWLGTSSATPRDLQPLPILGVPYFWANQDDNFYADSQVFRSGRRNQAIAK